MRQVLHKCNTVFDVGANIGHWAKLALQINPDLNLHCFEPSRSTFQELLSNKFQSNVICNNFGFSSTSGEACMHVFRDGSALNSLYKIFPEKLKQVSRYDQRFENFQYQNWAIIANSDANDE